MVKAPSPRAAIRAMAPYNPPLEGRRGKLRLDFNENVAGCSPKVLEALRASATQDFLATYPEYGEARSRLGAYLGVRADQTLLGAGTDELIGAVVRTYLEPGDQALIPRPSFSMFRFFVELAGAVPRQIPYRPPSLEFPVEELAAAIGPRTRAICIASPNNPTGGALSAEDADRILRAADGCAVLIDEAYFDFHGETLLGFLGRWPNLFVTRTFSKAYGMAGLRIGVLASQAENIAAVGKGHSPYSVNSLAVRCALAAIDDPAYVRGYVQQVLEARELACGTFAELGIRYWPSRANFVLFELGDQAAAVCAGLAERGILIRDQSAHIPGAVRATVGPLAETTRFLAALKEVLKR